MSGILWMVGMLLILVCTLVGAWLDGRRERSFEEYRRRRLMLRAQTERGCGRRG